MSGHKKKATVHAGSGIVVMDGKKPLVSRARTRAAVLAGGAVVIIAIVAVAVWALLPNNKSNPTNDNTKNIAAEKPGPYDSALQASINGNPSSAQQQLDSQLASASSSAKKVEVYQQKLTVALNAEQYDQVISLGQQSEAILPSSIVEQQVATAYNAQNNKPQAKVWLQKAIDHLDKNSPIYQRNLDDLQSQLAELQQ